MGTETVDFGPLTVPAQRLEEMVNWRTIHGTPVHGSQYITVDPSDLAEHAGFMARFPLKLADPVHAIFLLEGMQRYRDALGRSDVEFMNGTQFIRDWENFWSDDRNISLGMKNIVREATISVYVRLRQQLFDEAGKIKVSEGMLRAANLTRLLERLQDNEFGYNKLHDLQTLAQMTDDGDEKAQLAWSLIDILAEGAGPTQMLYAFSIMDRAFLGGKERMDLLARLASMLKVTSNASDAGPHDDVVGRTLDLLHHSQLTPEIEEDLAGIIGKALDPSTYPRESARTRDEKGNVLTRSSDIYGLILNFLTALASQSTVPGSLPARLLHLAADKDVQVNGAFIGIATLALAQSARGGTLASYYGEPLFIPGVRTKLTDLHFSPDNVDAVDAFLEHEVYNARRGGGGMSGRGPMFYAMPLGMSAVNMAGARMFTGMPMSTMPLALLNLGL